MLAGAFVALPSCGRQVGAQSGGPSTAPAPSAPHREPLAFVEGETCTRTEDCPEGARCFDGRCVLTRRSLGGEILSERGARSLARSQFGDATEAFRLAVEAYRSRDVPVPASVLCGRARALVAQNDRSTTRDGRETTAVALRECLSAAPPNSALADHAVAELSALSERGLDLAALDRQGATLMTGRDPRPTAENTRVRLTFTGQGGGSRAAFRTMLDGENITLEIVRCFLQWWRTSHRNEDEGSLRVTYHRSLDDYDELQAPRLLVTAVDIVSSADAGANTHWLQCSAQAIQSAAGSMRWPSNADRWAESIVIGVRPG